MQLGAHGQLQGLGAHWELWMLQQGGMTPMEALRAATIDGARYLGLDGELGSLEKGKLADLIVLDRNPLENIRHSDSVSMVMSNGRLYDGEDVERNRQPSPRAAAVLVRERAVRIGGSEVPGSSGFWTLCAMSTRAEARVPQRQECFCTATGVHACFSPGGHTVGPGLQTRPTRLWLLTWIPVHTEVLIRKHAGRP